MSANIGMISAHFKVVLPSMASWQACTSKPLTKGLPDFLHWAHRGEQLSRFWTARLVPKCHSSSVPLETVLQWKHVCLSSSEIDNIYCTILQVYIYANYHVHYLLWWNVTYIHKWCIEVVCSIACRAIRQPQVVGKVCMMWTLLSNQKGIYTCDNLVDRVFKLQILLQPH